MATEATVAVAKAGKAPAPKCNLYMAVNTSAKAIEALKALQADAKSRGLDKMSMDEINAEIAAHRREKRLTAR